MDNSSHDKTEGSKEPSLTMLIKLLKMTTSSNDNEAMVAMRKANLELSKFGGDWEPLLRGKVTVIGDPFAVTPVPEARRAPDAYRSPPQQAPRPSQPYGGHPYNPPPRAQAPQPASSPNYAKPRRRRFSQGVLTEADIQDLI